MTSTAAPALAFPYDEALARERARSLGVPVHIDEYGPQADLPAPAGDPALGRVGPLLDLGLLSASGDDAVKFLHAQLTNDVEHLVPGTAQWFGYCNAKGRLQGSFLGWRADTEAGPRVRLAVSLPLAETLRRRLSMFVLRAKLKITDDSAAQVCFGLSGEPARAVLVELLGSAPEPYQVVLAGGSTLIGLPEVPIGTPAGPTGLPRWQLWADADKAPALWATLSARLLATPGSFWRWLEVRSGIARIVPGTWELFVPQMVNFELVGGVNFKKGCYPGQEVVARSQYLGKLKRRMFLGAVHGATPQPGSDVMPGGAGEPCGQVVLAAPAPDGAVELLFESQTAAAQAGGLTVAGAPLDQRPLPYAIPG